MPRPDNLQRNEKYLTQGSYGNCGSLAFLTVLCACTNCLYEEIKCNEIKRLKIFPFSENSEENKLIATQFNEYCELKGIDDITKFQAHIHCSLLLQQNQYKFTSFDEMLESGLDRNFIKQQILNTKPDSDFIIKLILKIGLILDSMVQRVFNLCLLDALKANSTIDCHVTEENEFIATALGDNQKYVPKDRRAFLEDFLNNNRILAITCVVYENPVYQNYQSGIYDSPLNSRDNPNDVALANLKPALGESGLQSCHATTLAKNSDGTYSFQGASYESSPLWVDANGCLMIGHTQDADVPRGHIYKVEHVICIKKDMTQQNKININSDAQNVTHGVGRNLDASTIRSHLHSTPKHK